MVEPGLQILLSEAVAIDALDSDINRIVQAGRDAVAQAGSRVQIRSRRI